MKKTFGYITSLIGLLLLPGCGDRQCTRIKGLSSHTVQSKNNKPKMSRTHVKLSTAGLGVTGRRLFDAAYYDNTTVIKALIAEDVVEVNTRNKIGETALHQAVLSGSVLAVSALLAADADPNIARTSDGRTALHHAVETDLSNDTCIIQLLLSAGAVVDGNDIPDTITPLHIAVTQENIPAVRLLCAHKADPNRASTLVAPGLNNELRSHYYFTSVLDHLGIASKKIRPASLTPLHLATLIEPGEHATEIVKLLVEAGARPDISIGKPFNLTPIHLAACMGNAACIKILCTTDDKTNMCGTAKVTPLHIAAAYARANVTQALLANGAAPNTADGIKQTTPLMVAAESMQTLVRAGAKQPHEIRTRKRDSKRVSIKPDDKSTHLAQMEQTVHALLDWQQTNLFARDSHNRTVYDIAKETVERIDKEIQSQKRSREIDPNSLGSLIATICEDKLRSNRRRARHTLDIIKMAMRQRSATVVTA